MKTISWIGRASAIFSIMMLLTVSAQAEAIKVYEKKLGDWKASCFREASEKLPYCRIMVVKITGSGKARNFAQFGPAWDGDKKGVVVASYLGFAQESAISLAIDDVKPWSVRAPAGNMSIGIES